MNCVEFVEILVFKNDLFKVVVNVVLEILIDIIQMVVKKGDVVQLVGFGIFKLVKCVVCVGKNLLIGVVLKIFVSMVFKFVVGVKFKVVVDFKVVKCKVDKVGK